MKKTIFFVPILVALCFSVCYSQTGWHQLSKIPPIPKGGDFYDVSFLDSNTGFVLGGDAPNGTNLFKTTDGGNTWATIPVPKVGYLAKIIFPSPNIGIIGGWNGHTTVFLRSNDSGKTWVHLPVDSAGQIYLALTFTDSLYCYAGTYFSGNDSTGHRIREVLFLKSTDAGLSWKGHRVGDGGLDCASLSFADRNRGMMVARFDYESGGGDGELLQTTDGGDSWKQIKLYDSFGQYVRKYSIVRYIKDKIWLAYTDNGLYKTTDDGANWSKVVQISFFCISSNKSNICYGYGNGGDGITSIMKSEDAGDTWRSQFKPVPYTELNNIFMVNENIVYATGYLSGLLKTTDGGGAASSVTEKHSPLLLSEITIAPNPSYGSFSITLPSSNSVGNIEIIDVLGRVVRTIPISRTEATYRITDLSQGIYYCRYDNVFSKIVVQ